jgi:hypothetical protein
MARILVDGVWYEELSSNSLYESEIERILLQNADTIFPAFYLIPFKKTVFSEDSSAKADFVLIDKQYREWWVVELEISSHSLKGHVIPQVQSLLAANYGEEEASYILQKTENLDSNQLQNLITNHPPNVMVIVNSSNVFWQEPLKKIGVDLFIFEIFRSDKNQHIFRINGKSPIVVLNFISKCYFQPYLPNILFIETPKLLQDLKQKQLNIYYGNGISDWILIEKNKNFWLIPSEANPLPPGYVYDLFMREDGTLLFIDAQTN